MILWPVNANRLLVLSVLQTTLIRGLRLLERVVCCIIAAVKYEIPANILLTIAEKEERKSCNRVTTRTLL